ncbi:MAG: hypothetical protein F4Y46_00480, partial [Chloroflexi bacterium]|nr:hypothetical protein [Chloroflexota bacterium]
MRGLTAANAIANTSSTSSPVSVSSTTGTASGSRSGYADNGIPRVGQVIGKDTGILGTTFDHSARGTVAGGRGMVAAGHPLAAGVGLQALARGGHAFDAAVAMAAAIAVVEPAMNSIGGDAFAIVKSPDSAQPQAFNSSGPAPAAARARDYGERIAPEGLAAATIPAAVRLWEQLHGEYGRLKWADLLAPAIEFADRGVPVSQLLAGHIQANRNSLARFPDSARTYLPGGAPLRAGETLWQRPLARTLAEVSERGAAGLAEGSFAGALEAYARDLGLAHRRSDFQLLRCDRLAPLSTPYLGRTVWVQPPVSQGYVTLAALAIADLAGAGELEYPDPVRVHIAIEAKKQAFQLRHRFLGDPDLAGASSAEILDGDLLGASAARIDHTRAARHAIPEPLPVGSDTTCLAAADAEGNSVAYIQSIFAAFGSRAMVPGTGVMMNNRMTGFSLDPRHPNFLRGGRRPVHTLMTWMVTDAGLPVAFGSTAGGHYQVQTNQQVIDNHLRFGMDLQRALEAPRWGHDETSGDVYVEERFGAPMAA